MDIIDFSNEIKSERHGRYLGQAGDKDGVIYNGDKWVVKYPKSTKGMLGKDLPEYTSSPLSEYLGSHIYEILGYDVHKTMLVYRNNQIAVACKDFQKHFGDLAEIRGLKNSANREMKESLGEDTPLSATGDRVNLEELLLHFKYNPLMNRDDLIQRFWDCVVIDIFIDNNDRNNGNWGLLFDEYKGSYELAPIYDNGNSFNNKISEKRIVEELNHPNVDKFIGNRTIYEYNGHILSAKKMLSLDFKEIQDAIIRVVPLIENNLEKIMQMIDDVPNKYKELDVFSDNRKQYYKDGLTARLEFLLKPALKTIETFKDNDLDIVSEEFENEKLDF